MDWFNDLFIEEAKAALSRPAGNSSGGVSSWNDLTDKPFYKEVTVVNEPLNMTWDYDWADHLYGTQKVNDMFGKVSDLALTDDQIKAIEVVYTSTTGGGPKTYALSDCWEATANIEPGFIRDGSCVLLDADGNGILIAFVRDADTADFTDILGVALPEPGIYLNINHYGYVSSLTTAEPIEQRTETLKRIDPEYLPEGYPYKESRVSVDLSAVFGTEAVLCKVSDDIPQILAQGAQVKVWKDNGVGASTVAVASDNYFAASEAMVFVSYADNVSFDDFGVPIAIPEKGVYFLSAPGTLTVTGVAWDSTATDPDITWDGVVETIHTMAPEFLPAGVGGGVQVVEITESNVDGETVRTSSHTAAEIVEMAETSAVVGKLVALDGTVIVCALSNTFAVPSFGINAAYFWYILSASDGSAILKFLEVGADKTVKMYSATIGS